MNEELACQLQAEEVAIEKACQERDATSIEVVMEAARPLIHSQIEGLGAPTGQVVVPS